MFDRLKKTPLFGTDILIHFFNENENYDVKIIIPSPIAYHITIPISIQINEI